MFGKLLAKEFNCW